MEFQPFFCVAPGYLYDQLSDEEIKAMNVYRATDIEEKNDGCEEKEKEEA